MRKTVFSLSLLAAFAVPVLAHQSVDSAGIASQPTTMAKKGGANDPKGDRGHDGTGHHLMAKKTGNDPKGDRGHDGTGHHFQLG